TGPSHTKGHLTITYARTAEWLAQRGKGAAQTTSQVRPSTPVRPATPRKPMSRGAKIGCGIVACFVLFILTLVILGTASYANQHPITSDALSTPTVDTQATNDAH